MTVAARAGSETPDEVGAVVVDTGGRPVVVGGDARTRAVAAARA
jgi:hypothetical protein